MNKVLPIAAVALALAGCSFAARSPQMYADETKAALEKKNEEIKACYDAVLKTTPGVGGQVAVKFEVETEHGSITNVTLDQPNTTAPGAVADCVIKSIGTGLALNPPDARKGEGTWMYQFNAPPPPPAPPPAAAPKG